MTRLERYRQLHASLKQQMEAILDQAQHNADGRLTAEQQAAYDALKPKLAAAKEDYDRENELARAELSAPAVRTTTSTPSVRGGDPRVLQDPKRGFEDLADFALAVRGACRPGALADERLDFTRPEPQAAPTNYHKEAGADEGYMVPPEFRDAIWAIVFGDDTLLAAFNPEPTNSNAVDFLADESTPWGATGVQAKWRAEGSVLDASKLATKLRQVRLHELFAFVLATEELLEDAPRLSSRLTEGAARAILWKAIEGLMWGTGAGQPLGWMKAGSLVTQTKESGQAADTIVTKNVTKMYSRLLAVDGSQPFWIANRDIFPQLAELAIGNQPIWTPPNAGFQGAPGGFLLGYPILWSEHAATLGDKGDLQLVSPAGYYATTKRGGAKFDSSIHLFFDYAVQAFRWLFRIGGQPFLEAAVSPARGSATKSHFVVIDDRT